MRATILRLSWRKKATTQLATTKMASRQTCLSETCPQTMGRTLRTLISSREKTWMSKTCGRACRAQSRVTRPQQPFSSPKPEQVLKNLRSTSMKSSQRLHALHKLKDRSLAPRTATRSPQQHQRKRLTYRKKSPLSQLPSQRSRRQSKQTRRKRNQRTRNTKYASDIHQL